MKARKSAGLAAAAPRFAGVLADRLPGYSRARCFEDMDAWGYTFILGSAQAWFERDSDDAQDWLRARGLID